MKREMTTKFEPLVRLNLSLLKFAGVISRGERSLKRITLACLTFVCMGVNCVSYLDDFCRRDATLQSFSLVLSFVGALARFLILLLFRGNYRRMLDVCELLWSGLDSKEKRIVEEYARKSTRLTGYYLFNCMVTIFFYVLFSLLASLSGGPGGTNLDAVNDSNVSFDIDEETERHLPYAFFIEVRRTPWYEIAYVFQVFSVINVGLTGVGVDMAAPLFALIACGHFEVIRSRIENLNSSSGPENLRVCLIYHQTLVEFCDEIERCAHVIFLTQLTLSTYNISLVGFKLVGDDPDKYKYLSQLFIVLIQLFLCNWPADLLLAKSEAIAAAAYFSSWYQHPVHLRMPISMLMIRARRPACLTAGKFVQLSLETFGSMISTSISFFTVVSSTN